MKAGDAVADAMETASYGSGEARSKLSASSLSLGDLVQGLGESLVEEAVVAAEGESRGAVSQASKIEVIV